MNTSKKYHVPLPHQEYCRTVGLAPPHAVDTPSVKHELCGEEDFHAPTPMQPLVELHLTLASRASWDVTFGGSTDAFSIDPVAFRRKHLRGASARGRFATRRHLALETRITWSQEWSDRVEIAFRLNGGTSLHGSVKRGCVSLCERKSSHPSSTTDRRYHPRWTQSKNLDKLMASWCTEAKFKVCGRLYSTSDPAKFLGSYPERLDAGYVIQTDPEILRSALDCARMENCSVGRLRGSKPRIFDETPLSDSDHRVYRQIVGKLLFCCAHRGDVAV